ncbi:hypothetical protein EG832_11540 [bacterium]|nr:hypothetical protein [bacterium]
MSVITVIEQINEITEEIIESTVIEVGDIVFTETDLVINTLPVKSEIHPDDLLLIEDAEDTLARKQIKASRLTDGGQFT